MKNIIISALIILVPPIVTGCILWRTVLSELRNLGGKR